MKKKCISVIVLLLIIIFLCYGETSNESLAEQQEAMPVMTDVIVDDLKMTALCEDGSVWSWDRDQEEASACKIPNLNNIKKIMYAGPAMYALSEDGYVYAWGSNEWQQISTEEDADRNFEEAEQVLGLNDIVDMDVSVDFDSSRAKIFAIDKSGNFYAWGIYLYWDEEQDFEPGFPKKNAELVQGVSKVFAGAGNYHYFIREDGTVFSIMDNSIWESNHINDFVFPQLPLELPDLSIDASPLPLSGISYVDLREGTKYGTTILYELGQEKDIKCIDADDHTVFIAREDGTLWYWNSKMIKYHDCKDALADPESGQEDYRGYWEKVDVKEVLGITDVNTQPPHIVDICAGSENVLFLTDDGQVFMSEYVTSATEDVEYYNLESTNPNRERTKIIEDLPLKTISFQKLEWEKVISINTDGNSHFSAVDETGKYFYIDTYAAKGAGAECFEQKEEKPEAEELDIEAFLDFDWTTDQVLMWDHTIEPEDSAQGWEFSIADIDFDDRQEMLISFPSNHCGGNSLYIYKQENGNVSSYADTIATPERCMLTGIDYKEISPYMDIDLLDAYVNEDNEYRYLSLDCSTFGGDFHGGIYTVILYETVFEHGGEPKEIARIEYCGPEELEELYFLGEKVYEKGKLRDMIALYMDGYTEVAVNYKTAEKTFARDVVAINDEEKKQELDELYESLKKLAGDL